MNKYPSGPINQHKSIATGAGLQKCDTSNKNSDPKGSSQPGHVHKSGTSTGKRK